MLSRSRKVRTEESRRARIVLGLAAGEGIRALGRRLEVSVNTISLWRDRFVQERLSGFFSRHPGRRPSENAALVEARIIDWTLHRQPADGSTHWSSRKLALQLGVNQSRVVRVWAKAGLQPHRLRRYLVSDDPDFETKAADVIGLYLKPPAHAVVFCVDEKSAIQALDRLDPVLPLSPGRAERHGFEYYRHGTLSLYAALETATGEVHGKTASRHTSAEFVAFLEDLVAHAPPERDVHFIVDNLSAHKTERVRSFLAAHPRVHLHFTPTYSSWLNQVEIWFSKIERDVIARGIFTSKPNLARKLMRYIRHYNKHAKPFKWTYRHTDSRILPKCSVSSDSVH
jgi:transposase